jgi:hypothetical protein
VAGLPTPQASAGVTLIELAKDPTTLRTFQGIDALEAITSFRFGDLPRSNLQRRTRPLD